MKNVLCYLAVLMTTAEHGLSQGNTGGIQGVLTDDTGNSLSGAYVIATPTGSAGGTSYTAVSGTDGGFVFPQVRAGAYILCAQTPHQAYLDPCRWSSPSGLTVSPEQVSVNHLRMAKGSLFHVRVNVPSGQLAAVDGANILLGILSSTSLFYPMNVSGSDAAGRTYDMAIPFDTPLRVAISSERLQRVDAHGNALPISRAIFQIQQLATGNNQDLTFTITGKR